jgi:hypothetical protein
MARTTFSGPVASTNGFIPTSRHTQSTVATLTAAQLATGYISGNSAAATNYTITLPRAVSTAPGVLPAIQGISNLLNAVAGQTFDFVVNNTNGLSIITIAVGTAGVLSSLAAAVGASAGLLTIPVSATAATATFRLTFTGGETAPGAGGAAPTQPVQGTPGSATGYTLTRIA